LWIAASTIASGCTPIIRSGLPDPKLTERDKRMMARAEPDEWRIPDIRYKVKYSTNERPGTIVVDTGSRHLYYVLPHGEAIEYQIATGAEAYGCNRRPNEGMANLDAHRLDYGTLAGIQSLSDPRPPSGTVGQSARRPCALPVSRESGHALRIHGTNEPSEIGRAVSSGCIRMRDMDAIDLYNRVHIGTPVVVI
jgi:hypothetical protein